MATIKQEDLYTLGPILLLGAPGAGKGTQAKLLMDTFKVPQISTGDILREQRRRHTELGRLADECMQRGDLVPDNLVNRMIAERLQDSDCGLGYVLDGFPRTLAQANWLDATLAEGKITLPVVAIQIQVSHDELLRRITGRRVCPRGHIYNVYTKPSTVFGICDLDGDPLEQRNDDSESVFEQRMKTFHEQTAPVIDHYCRLGRFCEVDGASPVTVVTEAIHFGLQRFRNESQVHGSI